jgi:uncharacterized membrane protein
MYRYLTILLALVLVGLPVQASKPSYFLHPLQPENILIVAGISKKSHMAMSNLNGIDQICSPDFECSPIPIFDGGDVWVSGMSDNGKFVGANIHFDGDILHPGLIDRVNNTIVDVGVLPDPNCNLCEPRTWIRGINSAGQVAGGASHVVLNAISGQSGETIRGFFWQSGVMTPMGDLGGNYTNVTSMNDRGQVVGLSFKMDGTRHPFIYEGGILSEIPLPEGATEGWADHINDRGVVDISMYAPMNGIHSYSTALKHMI